LRGNADAGYVMVGQHAACESKNRVAHRRRIEFDKAGRWRVRCRHLMYETFDVAIGMHDPATNSGRADVDDEDAHGHR
jgi:hypothetical protein